MTLQKKDEPQNQLPKKSPDIEGRGESAKGELPVSVSKRAARLEELESLPHRNPALHWGAFLFSLLSLVLLAIWVFGSRGAVPNALVIIDIALGAAFAVEFFTRSGFRWNHAGYLRSRFFDFIAIVPALALVDHGFTLEGVWVWLILVARFIRAVDRLLGDGFVQRTALALVWAFEEEITDQVLERILTRIQADMDRTSFSRGVAEAFARNKTDVLQRVRAATPKDGLVPSLAHMVGLVDALERAEERTYDAIVEILDSQEVDRAVRDVVNSSFSRIRGEIGKKSWRKHLWFRRRHVPKDNKLK
jgi:hypothetical protein